MGTAKNAAKKIAVLGILTGLSLVAFIIESLLPPLFVPGAKAGLANVFSLIALILYSPAEAFAVVAVKTFLGAVYAGNLSSMLYSFTGGVVSMALSSALMYSVYPKVSLAAISVAAAVLHNVTQNVVFVFLSGSFLMFANLPYLALLGVLSGAVVGAVTLFVFKCVPQSVFEKLLNKTNKPDKL
ncbi:MAG: Gx transporter family protein [Clostridia bacterium]|nr:Gx transporter family protein [Clostridia bacterium]